MDPEEEIPGQVEMEHEYFVTLSHNASAKKKWIVQKAISGVALATDIKQSYPDWFIETMNRV